MGAAKFQDVAVTPGYTGPGTAVQGSRLQVYQLTSGTSLPSTVFPGLDSGTFSASLTDAIWLNFRCDNGAGVDIGFFIMAQNFGIEGFGGPTALPVLDPTEHVASGVNEDRSCIWVPAGDVWSRRFRVGQAFRALQISGDDAYLRVEATSDQA